MAITSGTSAPSALAADSTDAMYGQHVAKVKRWARRLAGGLDGTRQGETLVIRYFFSGKLWGATLNAHAAGTLVPASPSPPNTTGSGGTAGGSGGVGGGSSGGTGSYVTLP